MVKLKIHLEFFFMSAGVNFINILCTAFTLIDSLSVKNTVKSSVSFYTFGIFGCEWERGRRGGVCLCVWVIDQNEISMLAYKYTPCLKGTHAAVA